MTSIFKHREKASHAEPYHYTLCGLDDVYLSGGFERVDTDYGAGVVIHHQDHLHRAIGLHLALEKKTLNGKEVRFLRHEMDLTQAQLGDILRVGDQTVARWEKGEVPVSGPAELLIRTFYCGHIAKAVDVRKLAEELRAADDNQARQVFAPTARGWAIAAWRPALIL